MCHLTSVPDSAGALLRVMTFVQVDKGVHAADADDTGGAVLVEATSS